MTTAGIRIPAPVRAADPARTGLRLVRLHLASRRAPQVLAIIMAGAVALQIAPHSRTTVRLLQLVIETATAMVIAAATTSPFGDAEHITGHRLPYLRLATTVTLTATAIAALSAGCAMAHLPGGTLEIPRDVAGVTGIGLLAAATLDGALAWTGPLTYLLIAQHAINAHWTTPWIWPARPSRDLAATLCAALVFATGTAIITARGAHDPAPE